MTTLYKLTDVLRETISGLSGMLEAGEITESDATDTLAGIQEEVQQKMIGVSLHIKNLHSDAVQLIEAKVSFDARFKKVKAEIDFYESYLLKHMTESNVHEIKSDLSHIKLVKCPPSCALDTNMPVPQSYCRHIPESYEPDKLLILKELKAGAVMNFAKLVTDKLRLSIK
jgi:hypothetical protein